MRSVNQRFPYLLTYLENIPSATRCSRTS